MAETLGTIIDKLITVDLKMWWNQELLYEIRRMDFDQFKEKYFSSEKGSEVLWLSLKKACDLNVQRNELIEEVDQYLYNSLRQIESGEKSEERNYVKKSHKTY